ncbi:MAG: hypothetical protein C4345_01850 [Chloroflexota bacterium]
MSVLVPEAAQGCGQTQPSGGVALGQTPGEGDAEVVVLSRQLLQPGTLLGARLRGWRLLG